MHTLVSFLGSAKLDPKTGYRTARYRFPDGQEQETPFFGLALTRYLQPDSLLILGTSGSMWPALIEHGHGEGFDEARLALMEASEKQAVTQELLDDITDFARQTLGRNVRLRLISYAHDEAGQRELLEMVASEVKSGEVSFDVTHGFRHLAMLGMLSAFMLSHARNLTVQGLWYGALEMSHQHGGVTPVVSLSGLLNIEQWLAAFVRLDASGDFSSFAPLLKNDGLEAEMHGRLQRAWGHLNVTNVYAAVRELSPLVDRLSQPLSGTSELFRERLRERLRWCKGKDLAEQQRALALQALKRGDFLRASLFGLEAFLSRETLASGGDPLDRNDKERAEQAFKDELKNSEHPDWKRAAYWLLKNVRNACAHGIKPHYRPHADLMKNPDQLRKELEATLNRLTNTPA